MSETLTDEEIADRLPDGWSRDGDEIIRTFEFDSYLEGVGFAAGPAVSPRRRFTTPA